MAITLTERAAAAVLARQEQSGVVGHYLRVAVVGGGCNGLLYDLYFVEQPLATDAVNESRGIRVAVDEASQKLLDGTLIDLPKGPSAGFAFSNPRARKSCSCGASFEV